MLRVWLMSTGISRAYGIRYLLSVLTCVFRGSLSRPNICDRSFGDWFGVANAYAAKGRLDMANGRFGEAASGFQLALKVDRHHNNE